MLDVIKKILSTKIVIFTIITLLFGTAIFEGILVYKLSNRSKESNIKEESIALNDIEVTNNTIDISKVKIDIKGAVKNPGVYEVDETAIINDCINLAGGLQKNAYTNNLNLSKKVTDEMVIYVFTKQEYNTLKNQVKDINSVCNTTSDEVDKCIDNGQSIIKTNPKKENSINVETNTTQDTNTIVNINTASLDQLMTLPGVGESKATAIITYREENSGFKSIDDIKNVSGIGDALFEKIKEFITI